MSGDVQPRKRKDKRKKKDEEEITHHHGSTGGPDEVIHIHKENKLGGNICSKIIFFGLLGALGVMVGLIIIEYHGSSDVDTQSAVDSPWSVMLEGWVDDPSAGHDDLDDHGEHDDHEAEHSSHEEEEHDEHGLKQRKKESFPDEDEDSREVTDHKPKTKPPSAEEEDMEEESDDEEIQDQEDDETSGGEKELMSGDVAGVVGVPGGADLPPSYVERRQTLIPAEIMDDVPIISRHQEGEHEEESEGEHEDEEAEEDVEAESFVKQTYEDLKAAYSQITPDESDAEPTTEDMDLKSTEYGTTESEPEPSETEEEEEEEVKEDDPLGQWKSASGPELLAEEVEDVQTGSEAEEESEDESPPVARLSGGPKSNEIEETQEVEDFVTETISEPSEKQNEPETKEVYENEDITNEADWEIKEKLDEADRDLDEGDFPNPSTALSKFSALLTTFPHSARALYGKARALDMMAELQRSNTLLTQAIAAYTAALQATQVPDTLLLRIANRTIDRIRLEAAKSVLEAAHARWPDHSLCRGYLGLTLKLQGHLGLAVPHLEACVRSQHPSCVNSHFYFHLGDALQRNWQNDLAMEIYEKGVSKGIFRSKYQRSLYNVDRLKAQPWWTTEETTYSSFFRKLESNWRTIKSEGLSAYRERKGYMDEAESLRDVGDWKQFELFARGKKYEKNCKKTPVTCQLIEELSAAKGCRRGQAKFSVMEGGTHVWPHCGPTNCRLRAHLGLVVPQGTAIRVALQSRTWEEGKVLVFDDSFEHEVWHNGTSERLVLIVDVWHPELTAAERASLTAI